MNNKKKIIIPMLLIVLPLVLVLFLKYPKNTMKGSIMINKLTTEKAMYSPGDLIDFSIFLESESDTLKKGNYSLSIFHLEKEIDKLEGNWSFEENEQKINITWQAPEDDFKGYMVKATLYNEKGEELSEITSAVDISSTWTKFPRFGYLTNFASNVDTELIIEQMKDMQLNSIEYYDWKYLHHQPIPEDNSMSWKDWAGREISGETIKSYINNAKAKNMINMSYNMIYGATNNYNEYGIKDEWGLYYAEDHGEEGKQKGDRFTFRMGESPSGQSDLFFFDIENKEWQDYIIEKNIKALEEMGFDGWHGDTVGEWGSMWTYDEIGTDAKGKYVKDGYTKFLNEAKKQLGDYYLSFNPVGAQGLENVSKSDVDVLYAEIWPWDTNSQGTKFDSYNAIKEEIDISRKESGGKSLIVPAYMEYDYAQGAKNQEFNMSAVLLTAASVYAAGGSRIELGDGHHMLSNEYFPSKNLLMSDEHKNRQKDLQNFIVAYENLLRDGLEDSKKNIEIEDHKISRFGIADSIWAYSKEDENYETIQLINLVGVTKNDWRANDGHKETPEKLRDLKLTFYTEEDIQSAWITSPDPEFKSASKELEMEKGTDDKGSYIKVSIPSLEYWNMIYLKKN